MKTIITHPDKIVKAQIGDELLECTDTHPFFVIKGISGTWIKAGELETGMQCLSSDGRVYIITDVHSETRKETTYNFEVADWHTYCVGKQHIVVHNTGGMCRTRQALYGYYLEDCSDEVYAAQTKTSLVVASAALLFVPGGTAGDAMLWSGMTAAQADAIAVANGIKTLSMSRPF